jgi:hypothetical protein
MKKVYVIVLRVMFSRISAENKTGRFISNIVNRAKTKTFHNSHVSRCACHHVAIFIRVSENW